MWLLGIAPGFSARARSALNCRASSIAPTGNTWQRKVLTMQHVPKILLLIVTNITAERVSREHTYGI